MRNWIAAAGLAALTSCQTAEVAEVAIPNDAVCSWLLMYGNASAGGLCRSLSPATQNLWVCELAKAPDIHTTFNASTQLHLTVREIGGCDLNSYIGGVWPRLAIEHQQPPSICGVSVTNYVARLNGVEPAHKTIREAFTDALGRRRISGAVADSYMSKARRLGCANL